MDLRNFKLEYKTLMRTVVTPLFKSEGFENRGQSFRRLRGSIYQYVTFEGNRRNAASSFSFTGNLSFLHATPAVEADFWCDDPTAWVGSKRMGFLTDGVDQWYRLEDLCAEDMATLMRATLAETVFPSLQDVCSADDVQAFMVAIDDSNRQRGLRLPSPFVQRGFG
ncbi:hypothetical protein J2W49_002505 [Hydrogenophaga palleronii]|uniref:DUF4304 domain-containing protein n=1 Tax=Hydrogenophaga palleronii TaxID=65655 RepID=A0ABU1WNC6_9BURK|nr:hypothetical protein [Hydrogenophaga palleronii]MDR7150547.1 hypothetical protein [Hydrogenophaga palleronii]